MKKQQVDYSALNSWSQLNESLKGITDEKVLEELLDTERQDRRRKMFLRRIHSRLNKVRADREREELES